MTEPVVDVAVVIPTIPPREHLLSRARTSVMMQTAKPKEVCIERDNLRQGAAKTRNAALAKATTEWVAFLDDDDEFERWHIEKCLAHAQETGADLVYPWFTVVGGHDPLGMEGHMFDPVALRQANYIPVTVLVKRELVLDVGGFENHEYALATGGATCEDWWTWIKLLDAGATFSHLPMRTWRWHHHGRNTQGCYDRW